MVSRHNLRGVADGTLQTFVSRNADVGGYWAVGVLCRLALEAGVTTVVIDLLSGEVEGTGKAISADILEPHGWILSLAKAGDCTRGTDHYQQTGKFLYYWPDSTGQER